MNANDLAYRGATFFDLLEMEARLGFRDRLKALACFPDEDLLNLWLLAYGKGGVLNKRGYM